MCNAMIGWVRDYGGVKFRHGTYNFRGGWSNAIDTVLKDNLLIEVYAL